MEKSTNSFQMKSQSIIISIQLIQQNVSAIESLIRQIAVVHDPAVLKSQIQAKRTQTQTQIKQTDVLLKELIRLNIDPSYQAQRERLVDTFTTTLTEFYKTAETEKLASFHQTNPFANHRLSSSYDDHDEQLQAHAANDLQELLEQERSIVELHQDVENVNEIFKTLGDMVHKQGVSVDVIDTNVENTADAVAQGAEELRSAQRSQWSLRKKKMYFIVIIAVVIAIVLAVLLWPSKK